MTDAGDPWPDRPVVVFDGVCNLCNRAVDFVVRHDRDGVFLLAANQSDAAARLLGDQASDLDTIVLVDGDAVHTRSDAVLRIAGRLPWPWRAAVAGVVVPRPLRDALYRLVARRRYRWFGRRDTCRLPSPEEAERFLA
jgi:predicted DCC family thiol-disulfide oxidoreductase YuxK